MIIPSEIALGLNWENREKGEPGKAEAEHNALDYLSQKDNSF